MISNNVLDVPRSVSNSGMEVQVKHNDFCGRARVSRELQLNPKKWEGESWQKGPYGLWLMASGARRLKHFRLLRAQICSIKT